MAKNNGEVTMDSADLLLIEDKLDDLIKRLKKIVKSNGFSKGLKRKTKKL